MTSEILRELQRLLSVLCDGELTATEQARLEELLDADAGCRRLYLEYLDMHARLLLHPRLRPMGQLPAALASGSESPTDRLTAAEWHVPPDKPLTQKGRRRGG